MTDQTLEITIEERLVALEQVLRNYITGNPLTVLARIASLRAGVGRLQQEIANLEREHEKEILAAALSDRQDAGLGANDGGEATAEPFPETPKVVDPNELLQRFIRR